MKFLRKYTRPPKMEHPKRWGLNHGSLRSGEGRAERWKLPRATPRSANERPRGWFF
jgi:hypothetical protein